MTTSGKFVPTVYLNDGATSSFLDGCTLVLTPDEHSSDERAGMDKVEFSFPSNKETQGPSWISIISFSGPSIMDI